MAPLEAHRATSSSHLSRKSGIRRSRSIRLKSSTGMAHQRLETVERFPVLPEHVSRCFGVVFEGFKGIVDFLDFDCVGLSLFVELVERYPMRLDCPVVDRDSGS